MPRLFVALRPPSPIRDRLIDTMDGVPGARWQDDDQLHLTLRFLGELDRHAADDVADAIDGVLAAPPVVALAGVGRFDRRGRIEALWAGVAPRDDLARLHRKVDGAAVRAGLVPERRAYLPHVTLARFGRGAGGSPELERWIADHVALASEPFTMSHLILYESRLGAAGATYDTVAAWPLAG